MNKGDKNKPLKMLHVSKIMHKRVKNWTKKEWDKHKTKLITSN